MVETTRTSPTLQKGDDARVAVIAVHGVADQAANETVRSVADLLLRVKQDAEGPVQYGYFAEQPLRMEVRRIEPLQEEERASAADEPDKAKKRAILGSEFAAHLERRGKERPRGAAQPSIDLQFTSAQIAQYDASLDPPSYDSLCLSAERIGGGKNSRTRVDVYEMYWADLSRLGSGLLRMVGELYQLFFHLSSLGRNTVDLAAEANPDSVAWRTHRFLHRLCDWTLAVPIGLLNLFLPLLTALFVLALVPEKGVSICAAVIWALLGLLVGGALVYRESRQPFLWWFAVQTAGFAVGWTLGSGQVLSPAHWLTYGGMLIVFAVVWWLAHKYDHRRPGTFVASLAIMLVLGVTIQLKAPAAAGAQAIVPWIMYQVELVFLALVVFWPLLIGGQVLAWSAGEWLIWNTPVAQPMDPESERRRTRRVVWTGRLGFALSTSLFLIVTLSVWAAVLWVMPAEASWGGLLKTSIVPSFDLLGSGEQTLGKYAKHLLDRSGGPLFRVFFLCTTFSLLMSIWAMLPSVAAEIAAPRDADRAASRKLGFWLDHGFRLARLAGSVLVFGLLVALAVGGVPLYNCRDATEALALQSCFDRFWLGWLYGPLAGLIGSSGLFEAAGLLLGGTTLSVVALGSRLGKLFVGIRPILDIALDVDNWLREHPLNHNPKSRILARYASLMRYIGGHRDAGGCKYDAVVIVAHSQGTVISADLLRYLHAQPGRWPFDADTPVYFLTMGCPLRQLYGLRFPHLYGWSCYRLPQPEAPLTEREVSIPLTRQPIPGELGVALWVNAYRSGDYVGRRLWIRDDDPTRWDPATPAGDAVASDAPGTGDADVPKATRIEFCIGPGAHTHYFDETAARMGEAIDQLIAISTVGKKTYRHRYPAFSA
ncbi:MAG: hypothetical protein JNM42_18095 [Propionivibrio sp.]|uniref:hypothetical protein n=1 Tax=Propionivibrio sp. TaxID=2212460 RepID=UPI001A5E0C8E|nr:hypothetical protein [Propionivibrio sp.]MBL8416339.1 hypothetical protein [Propionivibrio sp.]